MKTGILWKNLLIMVGYSILFMLLQGVMGEDAIGWNWGVLLVQILVLFIMCIVRFAGKVPDQGVQYLLAFLLVGLVGHGLCFVNGLLGFNGFH
ncbi:MAG: hypothetical protein ABI599_11725 [Flavobacteriales bacterium]